MALYDRDNPELSTVTIKIVPQTGSTPQQTDTVELRHFIAYEHHDDFLTPVAAGQFSVDQDELTGTEISALTIGSFVQVAISDRIQSTGIIDEVRFSGSPSGGTIIHVAYREWLSPAVDCHIDPNTKFSQSMSLQDVATQVFGQFGATAFVTDNFANRNAITGRVYGAPTTKTGKTLKQYILHQVKPYDAEGAFAFVARVAQRFGLWPRPAADGQTVVIAKPDYTQEPRYELRHRPPSQGSLNNVLDFDVAVSRRDQPSIIFGSGVGGGGEFSKATLRGAIINPTVTNSATLIASTLAKYPTVPVVTPPEPLVSSGVATYHPDNFSRPMFVKDRESHNQDQLNAFLLRELSLKVRRQLVARYSIEGHHLNDQPITVDTIISVDDDRANLHMPMWIVSRRFSKSRQGTMTHMELLRPGALQF